MAFDKKNWQKIAPMGAIGSGAGSVKTLHAYVSNDDASAVEGTNYFLSIYASLAVGDLFLMSLDLDGTPVGKFYQVTTVTSASVVIASVMDAPD